LKMDFERHTDIRTEHIKELSIIACVSQNGVIGSKNQLPWHLKGDLKHFKDLTNGNCVIMGNNTFKSIGKVLPNRHNIIITRHRSRWSSYLIDVVNSLMQSIEVADLYGYHNVFIIGGANIYQQSFKMVDKIYLTRVLREFEGDVYFPNFKDISRYYKLVNTSEVFEENGIKYQFEEYEKYYNMEPR